MVEPRRPTMNWRKANVLVTGGTGSFGEAFVRIMLEEYHPNRIVVFSRDELKQHDMRVKGLDGPSVRYFIGDVRDERRLQRAFHDIDIVVHAAALKQVVTCEYNPIEAVMTNIIGAKNVIEASLDAGVGKVIALSTDKAVNPTNLYGATKLVAEKLFTQANSYSGAGPTRFSSVRYGNVLGSRGSVVPLFLEQRKSGRLTITDPRMTRFWITTEQGVHFVISCIERMEGGEVFVPKIPSMNIMDLAKTLAPDSAIQVTGVRPGEKLHEILVSEDEARQVLEFENMFLIQPSHPWWKVKKPRKGVPVPEGFQYASNTNTEWLSPRELRRLAQPAP